MIIVRRSEETILQFIDKVKHKYPHLSKEQLFAICKASFVMVAATMKEGKLANIRLKYLGNFVVYPGRVKGIFNDITKLFEQDKMDQETFNTFKDRTDNYFNQQNQGHGKNSLD